MIQIEENKIDYDNLIKNIGYIPQIYWSSIYVNMVIGSDSRLYCKNSLEEIEYKINKNFALGLNRHLFIKRKGVLGSKIVDLENRMQSKVKNKGNLKHMKVVKSFYEYEFFLIDKWLFAERLVKKLQPKQVKQKIIKI